MSLYICSCYVGFTLVLLVLFFDLYPDNWSTGWPSWRSLSGMGSPTHCHQGRSSIFWKWFLGGTHLLLSFYSSHSIKLGMLWFIFIRSSISWIINLNRLSLWIYGTHFFLILVHYLCLFMFYNSSWPSMSGGWFPSFGFQLCAGASLCLYIWALHYLK